MSTVLTIIIDQNGVGFTARGTFQDTAIEPLTYNSATAHGALQGLAAVVEKLANGAENPAIIMRRVRQILAVKHPGVREFDQVQKILGVAS